MGILIRKRKDRFSPIIPMEDWEPTGESVYIDMGAYIPDSSVKGLYLSSACQQQVESLVEESLSESPVKEVGGFLLGNCFVNAKGRWIVSVLQLLPITPDYNSVTRLQMGTKAMLELDQGLTVGKGDYGLVGWFHTHPGHTPFLSATDLRSVHEPHFQKDYHIAVVLDSLTSQWDTGFFTRKADGSMNNKGDFPLEEGKTKWYSWKQHQ